MNVNHSSFLVASAAFLCAGTLWAEQPGRAPQPGTPGVICLEVFVRGDSELSAQASQFAEELAGRTRGLEVVVHDVLKDRSELSRLWELSRQSGREKPVVPAFHCCNALYFGFTSSEETGPKIRDLFTVDLYTRSTCSRCKAGKKFIAEQLGPRWPALRFRIYEITYDFEARRRYEELCRSRGQLPGLPTLHFAGEVIIGYQGDDITGGQYENLIRRVSGELPDQQDALPNDNDLSRMRSRSEVAAIRLVSLLQPMQVDETGLQPPEANSQRPPEPSFEEVPFFEDVPLPEEAGAADTGEAQLIPQESPTEQPSDLIKLPLFGEVRVSDLGLPVFTFAVGLVDGFNPCAMWILVFLLSVLVNIKDRGKILLIAGTFVVVSGVAYFAFMTAWLNVFMLIGFARPAQIILGVMATLIGVINVKDFFAFKKGISLSIPESSKPGLYRRVREIVSAEYLSAALAGVVVLAVIVNMVELLCTAGLPALYTQILTMQELPAWKNYAYLALYISAYMLDDTVLLTIVVATLSHRKLQEREGRWLKLISGLVILALGIVMIFKPSWLQLGQ